MKVYRVRIEAIAKDLALYTQIFQYEMKTSGLAINRSMAEFDFRFKQEWNNVSVYCNIVDNTN